MEAAKLAFESAKGSFELAL